MAYLHFSLFCTAFLSLFFSSKCLNFSFDFSPGNDDPRCPSNDKTVAPCIIYKNDSTFHEGLQITKDSAVGSLQLSVGRAVYGEPMILWDIESGKVTDFSTHFTFTITAPNMNFSGDGLAFFLSPWPSIVPEASGGGSLGLFNDSSNRNKSANHIVAVEFDTFMNGFDRSNDHVGIDVNSIESVATVNWSSSMKAGKKANAWVSYNGTTLKLSVFLTYAENPIFSGNSTLSYTIDLKKIFNPSNQVAFGFSAATGGNVEQHTILSWNFTSTFSAESSKKKNKLGLVIALVVAIALLAGIIGVVWFTIWRKKNINATDNPGAHDEELDDFMDQEFEEGRGPKRFPYSELAGATKNFGEEGKLGQGGFGAVYRGFLKDVGVEVAIKRISKGSKQGIKEYMSEVKIISRLRHRNLVQLIGWCHGHGDLLLVYEFMPNRSLDTHLYSKERHLTWPLRYKIVLGLASAILYLHEEWEKCVLHRDIKPSNVMLDSTYNSKLGDFGLARLVDHERGTQTTVLAGTRGYLAPECVMSGKASKSSDVYSFGVVCLEIACGRRPVEPKETLGRVELVEMVWDLYGKQAIFEAADVRLNAEFDEQQMERLMIVGLWCAHPDFNFRPQIKQVLSVLNFEGVPPNLPAQMPVPTYLAPPIDVFAYTTSSSSATASSSWRATGSSYGTNTSLISPGIQRSSSTGRLLKLQREDDV